MIQTSSDAQASSANPVAPVGRGAHPRRRGALVVALTVAALAVVVRPTGMAATTARDLCSSENLVWGVGGRYFTLG